MFSVINNYLLIYIFTLIKRLYVQFHHYSLSRNNLQCLNYCPNRQKCESQINVSFAMLEFIFLQSKSCGVRHSVKQKQQTCVYLSDVQILCLIFQNIVVEKFIWSPKEVFNSDAKFSLTIVPFYIKLREYYDNNWIALKIKMIHSESFGQIFHMIQPSLKKCTYPAAKSYKQRCDAIC